MSHPRNHSRGILLTAAAILFIAASATAAPLLVDGVPVTVSASPITGHCLRLTTRPAGRAAALRGNPALVEDVSRMLSLTWPQIIEPFEAEVGQFHLEFRKDPFEVRVSTLQGRLIQVLTFNADRSISFRLDDQPVLGLGEGGPRPAQGQDWRRASVEFDRRGRLHRMEPRWQSGAYGSRNPVALLIGTGGWGLYFAGPWGQADLRDSRQGRFLPIEQRDPAGLRQSHANQREQLGKGIPPMEDFVPGFRDIFIFDAREPRDLMQDLSTISGAAVMPPKWALGYMQSHRTLEDESQMLGIVDTFREKRIPLDAVIYLGTGFTPRGWNKPQPSFEFNPRVFQRPPDEVIDDFHERHVKFAVHMVPWDRDQLPVMDEAHLMPYWQQHLPLVKAGVDAWWPDEGDWFDLHERMKRHELYYKGPLSTQPNVRPWSLHRNGHLGVARWGGWIWSGDTQSTWKTLEAQIAVGINHSLSVSPYWGSDIGGFFSTRELTGELYARWFQFGAFCPSFRSHGRIWWTRLPWGWGLDNFGPIEDPEPPSTAALNDPRIEPIARRYAELRYQLLSYNYTLAWEARETGMPFMRALWLHYPKDGQARGIGDEYLWGRDLLVAPVYTKGAGYRDVYLPAGRWYDWWTGEALEGGRKVHRAVDLATMPIYVRAGAILPIDPIRQYTGEKVDDPLTIRVYRGADGSAALYEDDGQTQAYLRGDSVVARFTWDDARRQLTLQRRRMPAETSVNLTTRFRIEIFPDGTTRDADFVGGNLTLEF